MADLGRGAWGTPPPPPYFGLKKGEMTEGRKADRTSKTKPAPSLAQGLDPPLVPVVLIHGRPQRATAIFIDCEKEQDKTSLMSLNFKEQWN